MSRLPEEQQLASDLVLPVCKYLYGTYVWHSPERAAQPLQPCSELCWAQLLLPEPSLQSPPELGTLPDGQLSSSCSLACSEASTTGTDLTINRTASANPSATAFEAIHTTLGLSPSSDPPIHQHNNEQQKLGRQSVAFLLCDFDHLVSSN